MKRQTPKALLAGIVLGAMALHLATIPAASAVYRDYRHEALMREIREAQLSSDAARMKAEHEAAEPKANVLLDVSVKYGDNQISSSGPVASGSPLYLRMTSEREYIFSTTYGPERNEVGKYTGMLGDDIKITPSITQEGSVLVEVSIRHGEPSKKTQAPWADREFEGTQNDQTFFIQNGSPAITRVISMPGSEQGLTITLKADIERN